MGYTHYWKMPKEFDKVSFYKLASDVAFMMDRLPKCSMSAGGLYKRMHLRICGPHGTGNPIIQPETIRFNGDKNQRRKCDWQNGYENMMHESFILDRVYTPYSSYDTPYEDGRYGSFCKTARKPYDLLVCATLIRMKHHFGDLVSVSSDGKEEEWKEAITWCTQLFGECSFHLS